MRKGTRMLALEHARRGGEPDSRFRDRTGREHYDNGRFAPMRNDTNIEIEGRFRDDRGGERFQNRRSEEMNYDGRWDTMERRGGSMEYPVESRGGDYGRSNYGESRYPYGPFPVYQESDGMKGGGYDMNQIGFNANREMDGGRYRMDAGYEMRNEMEHRPGMRMAGGHASGMSMPMNKEMAEEWTSKMKNEDGTKGPHWKMEQVKQLMAQKGIEVNPYEFFAILNAMYSDYCSVFKKHGVNTMDMYVDLACAFLNDSDAMPNKASLYYEYIVKK